MNDNVDGAHTEPKVLFISYSHDSDKHRNRVLALSERLRRDGFVTQLDQYVNGTPLQGWQRWMLDQLDVADFVLLICTKTYYRRFRGHEEPGRGKGVDWEGALITQELYDARSQTLKFVPILFDSADSEFIPEPLRSKTHYTLNSDDTYNDLCDFLGGVAGVEPGPIGTRARKERRRATPLTFDDVAKPSLENVNAPAGGASPEPAGRASPIFDVPYSRNPWFTGRKDLLSELAKRLNKQRRTALTQVIKGLGGIGKTQTAVEFAYRHRNKYEAVFWIRCESESEITSQLSDLATRLKLPHDPSQPESAMRAVRHLLEQHDHWLLICDNADDPGLLKPFLPTTGTGHVLLTSRSHIFTVLDITDPLELSTLSHDEAITFLLKRAKRERDSGEASAASELARELGELPLALEQAAAYILEMDVTFEAYLQKYRKRRLDLLEETQPVVGNYPESVATTWSVNLEQVEAASPAAADLLRFSAFVSPDRIPFELPRAGAAELGESLSAHFDTSDPEDAVEQLLMPLARFALVGRERATESYNIHRLVQEVVQQALSEETRRTWAERTVRALARAFPSVEFSNWVTCHRLLPHALTGVTSIRRYGFAFPSAGSLLNQTGYFLSEQGRYAEAEPLSKQATEIGRTALGEDHPDFAASLNNLAGLYKSMGRYSEAEPLYQQATKIRRTTLGEDHPDFATSLNNLAGLYRSLGRYAEAEPLLKQAMEIRKTALGEDHHAFATCLNNLAGLYRSLGRNADAVPLYKQATAIIRTALGEDHPRFASCLNNLAALYRAQGRYHEAEKLYQQATKVRRTALGEDHPDFAISLNNLALLYRAQGRYGEAEPLYQQATEIWRIALGEDHPKFAIVLRNYAALLRKTDRESEADELEAKAAAIERSIPD